MVSSKNKASSTSFSGKQKQPVKCNYASKIVGKIVDEISVERLKTVKNPKATQKWLQKLRLSLLRKISLSSKTQFASRSQNVELLVKDIDSLREARKLQTERIKELCNKKRAESTLADLPALMPNAVEQTYVAGQFTNKTEEVKKLFSDVAQQLNLVLKDIEARTNALNNSVQVVEPMVEKMDAAREKAGKTSGDSNNKSNSGSTSSKKGSLSNSKKSSGSSSSDKNEKEPINRLLNHLKKN